LRGRATRGYIGVDLDDRELVWMKDTWRIEAEGMESEAEIYKHLADRGDESVVQRTMTLEVAREYPELYWSHVSDKEKEKCGDAIPLESQVHHRLVFKKIGVDLSEFRSTRELCQAVRDAVYVLGEAVKKADILHRDVSGGNILIDKDGRGFLGDFEFSVRLSVEGARRFGRTGTWRFMSIKLLQNPLSHKHTLADDLESILYV
ncbi:hypothetical protein K488DRAFT_7496, partial [Vararia minispora EC-137]